MKILVGNFVLGIIYGISTVFAAPSIWEDDTWYWNNRNAQTYTLTTASQLAGLAKLVNGGTFSFRGRTITLGADIFLNDTTGVGDGTWGDEPHRNWVPIGTKDFPFKGVFDGSTGTENHRIYGLYIDSSSDYTGLFGRTDSAKIVNLNISVGKINSKNYAGTLIGRANYTEISNIRVEAEIKGSNDVGGLVGGGNVTTITDSYFEGDVTGAKGVGGLAGSSSRIIGSHSIGTVTGGDLVGGLVGKGGSVTDSYFKGDVAGTKSVGGLTGSGSVVINSYSEGNVIGTDYVGGLIGNGSISESYFEGNVKGADYVGGLAGFGTVVSSHSIGTVSGSNYVGGLAGATNWLKDLLNSEPFSNSYFEGKVVASENFVGGLVGLAIRKQLRGEFVLDNSYVIADIEGLDYVGGLMGNDSVEELNSSVYLAGQKRRISNCYSQGNIRGNSYVGGIIGKCSSNEAAKKIGYEFNIVACHHSGNIVGKSDYVGGIIGLNDGYRGNMDSSFHDGGDVSGINYVGGLIGFYDSLSVLANSHSEGNVSGSGSYVGGLAGCIENIELLNDSYSKGNIIGSGFVGGLAGRIENIKMLNNSYSEGNITGMDTYVGGVCGFSAGDSVDFVYHTNGDVNGIDSVGGLFGMGKFKSVNHSYHDEGNVEGNKVVGGLAGCMYMRTKSQKGTLKNSYSVGDVRTKESYTGGLIGELNYGDIDSSYHVGNVSSNGSYTGGLVGYCYVYDSQNSDMVLNIRNSFNVGDYVKGGERYVGGLVGRSSRCKVDSSYYEGDSVVGTYNVGGLIGASGSKISVSYSTADVSGSSFVGGLVGSQGNSVTKSYALGDVNGNKFVGGLVGSSDGSIYESWSSGDVLGNTVVGGLVGEFYASMNGGYSISNSYVNGNVTGNTYVGGLVGAGYAEADTRDFPSNKINRNYVSGTVNVSDEVGASGCIIGYMHADSSKWGICGWNLDMSYYDSTKCNIGVYGEFHGGGYLSGVKSQAKTTAEMQTQSTFEQWNFTDVWAISENSYPYHQKFANFLPNADIVTDTLSIFMYDGLPKTPQVKSIYLFGQELTEGVDYIVEYKHNLNAGTARIKICGVNAYSGCKVVKFEIAPIPIEITIDPVWNVVYTGENQTPEVKVYNGGTLMEDDAYTVEYTNNVNVGEASVIVTLKGNYSGTASTTFTIEKATPVISQNPRASDILIGESLALSELSEGISNVEGSFVWKTPEVKPTLENEGYAAEFIPTDVDNYNSVEMIVPVKVWDVAYVAIHLGDMTLDSVVVIKGRGYILPAVSDSIGYDFVGFYNGNSKVGNSGDEIVVNENTVVEAVYEIKTFIVKFVNGDTILQSEELMYGSLPTAPIIVLPENTAQYTYSFDGWDKPVVAVTGSVTYFAVINQDLNKYDVSFKDYDGSILKDAVQYDYGTSSASIVKPANPTRQETAKYTYTFKGWDPTLANVTEDAIYTAEYDSTIQSYQIVFANGNDELQSETVTYGEVPTYNGAVPTKQATVQWTYTFKGWNPAISSVVGTATYMAEFDSVINKYEVVFKDYDGSILKDAVQYDYGTSSASIVKPANPTRQETAKYTYTFKGWKPTLADVTEDAVYIAEYDSIIRGYQVVFANGNDELQSETVTYGEVPSYNGEVPTRQATAQWTYTFKGWNPAISSVVGAATYKAEFDSVVNKYGVVFKDYDGSILKAAVQYDYGTSSANIAKPTSPTRQENVKYTYIFKGWKPTLADVTEDAVYIAEYDSTIRNYTVTFVNGSKEMQSGMVAYGTMPYYEGETPAKALTDSSTYVFSGWDSELKPVSGDAVYSAIFDEIKREYQVRFANEGKLLEWKMVAYGEVPRYTGETPTKPSSESYSYEFIGWSPKLEPITKETDFIAVFDSISIMGMVSVADLGMSVHTVSRSIQISGAPLRAVYAIFDIQGRELKKGRVESPNFNITMPQAGTYFVRIGSSIQRISIK